MSWNAILALAVITCLYLQAGMYLEFIKNGNKRAAKRLKYSISIQLIMGSITLIIYGIRILLR